MKKVWKIVGIVTLVTILGAAAIGAVALAQDTEEGADWPFNFHERFRQAIAGVLGISVDEYDAAVETAQGQVLDEAVTEGWLTQDQAEQMRERMAEGVGPGMMPRLGPGMRGGKFGGMPGRRGGLRGGLEASLVNVAAEALDLSVKDLLVELQDGKSIADVAGEKGVDVQTIADTFLAQLSKMLNQAVADGQLTQARADWMLAQATTRVQEQLTQTFEFNCPCPGGFYGGPGMMRPGNDSQESPGQDDA